MTRPLCVFCALIGVLAPLGAAAPVGAASGPQPQGYTLTVTEPGNGTGTVSSSDGRISCPPGCSYFYMTSGPVTLTAKPAAGSSFSGWSGSCTGTAPSCTVVMTTTRAVSATFTKTSSGPPPPPAPSCTLRVPSTHVVLAAPKSQPAKRKKVGKLGLSFRCNQAVTGTLTIKVVESVPGVHHHRVTYRLVRHYALAAHHTRTVTIKLWAGALRGLKRHHHESLSVTFAGTNHNGGSATGFTGRLT